MEHVYSIMPLADDHFDERVADLIDQYKRRITSCPMFVMTLVPEGDPVIDKAEGFSRIYARYRDALAAEGVPSGVLVQSSLGHGGALTPAPFQRMVGFSDGVTVNSYCPMDKRTVSYLASAIGRIASEHPSVIMLDDDFRVMMRPHEGCACPLHMAAFNERNKTNMTREQLVEYIKAHPRADDPLTASFEWLQREGLVEAVKAIRAEIDAVDPKIQGVNCTSGDECDTVTLTNPIFAGKGNPTVVRVPNGTYSPISTRQFSDTMRRAAVSGAKCRKYGIDFVLAETDTVPFNRYSKNARYLHAHYTYSILEGLRGAKHWITRLRSYEPKSGVAFRDILARHASFYDELARITEGIRFVGAASRFLIQENHVYFPRSIYEYHSNFWVSYALERLGIPFYFTDKPAPATFIESNIVSDMTENEIKEMLEGGSVFATAEAASDLVSRGYGDSVGVEVSSFEDKFPIGESFDGTLAETGTAQKNARRLTVTSPKTEALSYSYRKNGVDIEILSPAVTALCRDDGKYTFVFAGDPKSNFFYAEGFSFLCESRKSQLISLLKRANALPIYAEGDNELCLRAGYLSDGRLLAMLLVIGFDPEEDPVLYLEKAPKRILRLLPDGSYADTEFTPLGDSLYSISATAEPMYPLVLVIE
ncbi:MAG: hypothetical protein E7587_02165 [Ruminococcaceae bacterium]|nr:hypothetical protein [Oscillospiraceae bacterium]